MKDEWSMSKRTILILSIGAIIIGIAGWVVLLGAAASCTPATSSTTATCSSGAAGGALVAILLLVIAGILTFLSWLFGLIKTARSGKWGWFILVFLISPLGSLIYGAAGPEA
jgi:hypothetical protein